MQPASTLPQAFAEFIRGLEHEGKRPNTVVAYERDLRGVASRLPTGEAFEDVRVSDLDDDAVASALESWAEDHAASSVRRAHAAWRAFLRWAEDTGHVDRTVATPAAPTALAPSGGPVVRAARDVLFAERVALAALTRTGDRARWPLRDRALVALVSRAALTLPEAVGLDVGAADLDRPDPVLEVSGRGGRSRAVPIDSTLERALRAWLQTRHHIVGDVGPLLLDRKGHRLTVAQGRYAVLSIAAHAEPHVPAGEVFTALRRSAVHRWSQRNVPPDVVSQWMGLTVASARRWLFDAAPAPNDRAAMTDDDRDALHAARHDAVRRAIEQRDRAERLIARAQDVVRSRSSRMGNDEAAPHEREPRDPEH